MEFWASLEHPLRYKKDRPFDEQMQALAGQWLV